MTTDGRTFDAEALVTDRYLDALLATAEDDAEPGTAVGDLDEAAAPLDALDRAVRLASRRLTTDLPRFHPSFRFEERLAARLAEAAAAMRLPLAAGAETTAVPIPIGRRRGDAPVPASALPAPARDGFPDGLAFDPLEAPSAEAWDRDELVSRPLLVGGAVAASAISLAGAAWLAWRRVRPTSAMSRAARAAHGSRPSRARRSRLASGRA